MSKRWRFVVHGPPIAQSRPRFARCGRNVRCYDAKRAGDWKTRAAIVFRNLYDGEPLDVPVRVDVRIVVERPKRLLGPRQPHVRIPCVTRPDVDNFAKAVLDALTRSRVVVDDAFVVELSVVKQYRALDEGPRVEVDVAKIGAA